MRSIIIYFVFLLTVAMVFISCDKDVSVSPEENVTLEAGSAYINSNPPGAEIWVDSIPSGFKTPDTVKWLSEGSHLILLKTPLFKDHEFSIAASNEKVTEYYYDYYADPENFGSINVKTIPAGSQIYLNDAILRNANTPYTISSLIPRSYKIKVTFPEHRADSAIVKVLGSQQSYINFTLVDTSTWVNYSRENSDISGNTIYDVFVDEENLIWMATRKGLARFNGKSFFYYDYGNSPIVNEIVNKIKKDAAGNFWVGTIQGLNKITNGTWESFTPDNSSLPGAYVADFDYDNLGNILIGTSGGLLKIEGSNWEIYNTLNSGLPGNFVKAVAFDRSDNSIWLGTNGFGIAHFDGVDKWEYFVKAPPDIDTSFTNERIDSDNFSSLNDEPYIMGNSISALIVDHNGIVWAGFPPSSSKGVPGGVQKYNGTNWETIDLGLIQPFVNSFYLADDNTVFVSTNNGIFSLNNDSRKIIRESNSGLPTDDIRAVYPDKKGTLWIASGSKGLIKYKNYLLNN